MFDKAVRETVIETDLDRHLFPPSSPYSIQELLDPSFLPD
ncbi:MAG: DUF29 family protein [Gammaproteobacteria bacterium]